MSIEIVKAVRRELRKTEGVAPQTLGFMACLEGKLYAENPFPEGTDEFRKWVDGYAHAVSGQHLK